MSLIKIIGKSWQIIIHHFHEPFSIAMLNNNQRVKYCKFSSVSFRHFPAKKKAYNQGFSPSKVVSAASGWISQHARVELFD
jgi:RNA:NAD 2'-phosphotransferase (TPT1/KptA family)